MKNKIFKNVLLAFLISLALLTLTGCSKNENIKIVVADGQMTMSAVCEKTMKSCAQVEFSYTVGYGNVQKYYCIGIAISENQLLVPKQAIYSEVPLAHNIVARVYNSQVDVQMEKDIITSNKLAGYQNGSVYVLKIKNDAQTKFEPVTFAKNEVNSGDVLLGIDCMPLSKGIEDGTEWIRAFENIVSAPTIHLPNIEDSSFTQMFKKSFIVNAFVTKTESPYKDIFEEDFGRTFRLSLSNAFLFNLQGEFVGHLFSRSVSGNVNNENTFGVAYAYKASEIKNNLGV